MSIKRCLFAVIATAIIGVSCNSQQDGAKAKINAELKSESDSLAYIIGINIAEQLHKMDSMINYAVVCKAIIEQSEQRSLISRDDARSAYLRYLLYVEPERRRGYEEQFLSDLIRNDRNYTRSSSGLAYHVVKVGDQTQLANNNMDWVTLDYKISRVGGEHLYPADSTQYATLEVGVIDLPFGLQESVKMLGKGGEIRSWIPSKIAYGETGNAELGIEPIETVLYDIKLVDVEKGTATQRKAELEEF